MSGIFGGASSGGSALLDKVTADTTVGNTGTETTIYTKSIVGGTLSTNNALRLTMQMKISLDSDVSLGSHQSLALRFKYGATTLVTDTISGPATGSAITNKGLILVVDLSADGATNAQLLHERGQLEAIVGSAGAGNPGFNDLVGMTSNVKFGTAAEDSTAAKTLLVSAQWTNNSASGSVTMQYAKLESLS
jgi:hypothetical protein